MTHVFVPVTVFVATLVLLTKLKSKDTGETALAAVCSLICGMIVSIACLVMALFVGAEAAFTAFCSAFVAEFKAKWNHISAAPSRATV